MNELDDDALALLRSTQDVGMPDADALSRVRRSVLAKAALGGGAGFGAVAASKTASAAGTTASVATAGTLKGLAALLLVGAATGGAYEYVSTRALESHASPPQAVALTIPTATSIASSAPIESARQAETIESVDVASLSAPVEDVQPHAKLHGVPIGKPSAPAASAEEPTAKPPSLRDDLERLREAQRALVDGSPERALDLVGSVRDGSPLAEERDALRSIARCTLIKRDGDASTTAEAHAFSQAHPGSSFGPRVLRACDSVK